MTILPQRKPNRLANYNYTQTGYYFVTICTHNRVCSFGDIVNGEMVSEECGKIVEKQWLWLKKNFLNVNLDVLVVMPNHFHGILIIEPVGNGRDRSLQKTKSLSELVGAFKTTSSKLIHQSGLSGFQWQKSFYDRVIRNDKELDKIREYIVNNPVKWELDEYYKHQTGA